MGAIYNGPMMNKTLTVVALASCVTGACQAASPPPVPENLLACSKLQDAAERVRCYDEQIATLKGASAPSSASAPATASPAAPAAPAASTVAPAASTAAPPVPIPAAAAPTTAAAAPSAPTPSTTAPAPTQAPASSQNTAAGAVAPEQPSQAQFGQEFLPRSARPPQSEKDTALLASITALQHTHPTIYYISLSNGQVWRQEGMQIMAFFRVGDDVRIEKSGMGFYRMSTPRIGAKNWVEVTRIQ
jgi:hypothetical protein